MENQIQTFVLISSIVLGLFILFTVYLVIKLKLNDVLLKKSEEKLKNFNETLQYTVAEKTKELLASEKKFRALYELNKEILESSPAGIIRLDKNMRISYVNPEMRNLLGEYPESLGNLEGELLRNLPNFNNPTFVNLINRLQAGKEISIAIDLAKKNEQKSYLEIKGVPIFSDSTFTSGVLLFTDITESIIAEEKLKQSFEMLQKATGDIIQAMSSTSEMRDP